MRVLVTGSSGRLGGEVAAQLEARGHDAVGLDRAPSRWTRLIGNVEDRGLVERAMDGAEAVVHTASLHAPDVGRVPDWAFVAANVDGTSGLLEAAAACGVRRFVYTSTTSIYGHALVPADRADWVTEDLPPKPRDVYDVTKLAAEALCERFAREANLASICLRTARFFPEAPEILAAHRLSRGIDVRDAAAAHVLAVENATVDFSVFNVSARSPFGETDLPELLADAPRAIGRHFPWAEAAFAARGWTLPASIDRVYVIAKAEAVLRYDPVHGFAALMRCPPALGG